VSPSKKANKPVSTNKKRSAQKPTTSARSLRATTKRQTKTARTKIVTPKPKAQPAQAPSEELIQEQGTEVKPISALQTNLLRIASLLAVVGITLYIYNIRDHVAEFEKFSYAGIFVIALMANATVLLPAPGVAIVYAMGAVFNPIGVGLAAGAGGAIGELSGYLAGYSGQAIIERTDIYNRFKPWVDKYGGWAILVLSAIPNPFFDVAGIAAGIVKMPMRTFLFFTWIGQMIKMTAFAVAGHYSLEWLAHLIK
jgi:membrane protein DedA with SNARE-associated domain